MKKLCLAVALAAAMLNFFPFSRNLAQAQEVGIRISPVKIDELVEPGEVLSRGIKVKNNSEIAKTFFLYVNDFVAEGENGEPRMIPAGTDETGLGSWIEISSEGIDFAPNEEKEVSFTVKVPENAAPGGYYGAVLVGTEPSKVKVDSEDKGAAMATAQKTACLVIMQVAGEVNEKADIREFFTDKRFYGTPFDVHFGIRIENTGNTHVKPEGSIAIQNIFGKDVAFVRVNENGTKNVLRESVRRFDQSWSGKMAFGRYRATLGLTFGTSADLGGQGKQSLYSEVVFWIIPWKIIIPIVLGISLALIAAFWLLRFYKERAVRKAMAQIGARRQKTARKKADAGNVILKLAIAFVMILIASLVLYFLFFA